MTSARALIDHLYELTENDTLAPEQVHLSLQESGLADLQTPARTNGDTLIKTRRATLRARGERQIDYVGSIKERDLTFGIGPAGTGKTFLAVACAVEGARVRSGAASGAGASGGRGRRAARLPARGHDAEGRPVPAPDLRRALRVPRHRAGRQARREERHRDRPARLHARANAQPFLRDHGRGAEHHPSNR